MDSNSDQAVRDFPEDDLLIGPDGLLYQRVDVPDGDHIAWVRCIDPSSPRKSIFIERTVNLRSGWRQLTILDKMVRDSEDADTQVSAVSHLTTEIAALLRDFAARNPVE